MEVKHWFKVALMLRPEEEGELVRVRGVQRVYVDDEEVFVDLANVFVNLGIEKLTVQQKAFILRNSRVVAKEPMMIEPAKVSDVLLQALTSGLLGDIPFAAVQEYILDLNNHVVKSAVAAYLKENALPEEDDAAGGDDE